MHSENVTNLAAIHIFIVVDLFIQLASQIRNTHKMHEFLCPLSAII